MAVVRCGILAGLCAIVCGCAATRAEPVTRLLGPADAAGTTPTGTFAEMPRVPGERILRNSPAVTEAATRRIEPTVLPTESTPAVAVATLPTPVDPPLIAALRAYLNDKPEAAAEALKSFDRVNRELLHQLLPASVRAGQLNFAKAGPTDVGALAAQLETPLQSLSPKVPLSMTKTLFCTEISGFGRYQAVPEGSPLSPGEWIQVYAELRNVPSTLANPGSPQERWVTDLRTTLKIRDANGNAVPLPQANGEPGPSRIDRRREETQSPIRDYYVPFLFAVPKKPGGYTVHVEIVDPAGGRYVTAVMPLRVGS